MTEIGLQSARVVALVGPCIAASVPAEGKSLSNAHKSKAVRRSLKYFDLPCCVACGTKAALSICPDF